MDLVNECLERQIRNLLKNTAASQRIFLSLDDCIIRFETNSSQLRKKLETYFSPFITHENQTCHIKIKALDSPSFTIGDKLKDKKPEPGKTRIKEQFIDLDSGRLIRKKLTDMLFYFNAETNLAFGPCTENDNQVINFINNRFIQWKLDQGCLLCHAAAVDNKGRGLILAGFSGRGKSTLALHLMNKDMTFISNDRLMVTKKDSGLFMYGVPKLPRVNPGTILNNPKLFPMLSQEEKIRFKKIKPHEIWDLECKYDVYLDKCFGPDRFKLQGNVSGLVILNWHRTLDPTVFNRIDLSRRPDLLETIMKSPGLFYASGSETKSLVFQPGMYVDMFSDCPVYEVSGGINFAEACNKCLQLIS
ncbi:MAG: HprK-related kinase B [Desulfonatronovibrio sp.]